MKFVLLLIVLFFAVSVSGQKKIKTPIILSSKDTVRVDDVIVLKKGTEPDGRFKFVRTVTSSFPAPAKCEGYEQEIYYFKNFDEEYKAFTVGFVVSLEDALKSGEIEIPAIKKKIMDRIVDDRIEKESIIMIDSIEKMINSTPLKEIKTLGIDLKCVISKSTYLTKTPPLSFDKIVDLNIGDTVTLINISLNDNSVFVSYKENKGYLLKSEVERNVYLEKLSEIIQKKREYETKKEYEEKQKEDSILKSQIINIYGDSIAKHIKCNIDDFTGKVTYYTPLCIDHYNKCYSAIAYKIIANTEVRYYLSFKAIGNIPIVDGSGVKVLFIDNTVWEKLVSIDVEATEKGFKYSVYIPVTYNDIDVFASKKIKKFRLYIFDETVGEDKADDFMRYVKCLKMAK